jgi:raffinose/stachyose/melibiose transport system substrate-binding protein
MFGLGQGAIYPAGSWDISVFRTQYPEINMGAFPPPLPEEGATCYISDHTDIAMGMNANTPHPEEARIFLEWMTSPEFASLYSNALPGFFTLSNHDVTLEDPIAQEFLDWRQTCESTIRSSYQILSRGEPNNETDLWTYSAQVLNGDVTPQEAADAVQSGLEAWYEPQMAAAQ